MTKTANEIDRFDRQLSLTEFERVLDSGNLYVEVRADKWYQVRRNGATKRWKRDATRWEVPIKAALRDCMRVKDSTSMGFFGQPKD